MKSISVALLLAVSAVCLCFLQSQALPFTQTEVEEKQPMEYEASQQEQHWNRASAQETGPEEVVFRTKRQSHLSLCRYCCKCCSNKGCGYCCRF
ncbi:hepcidin-1 [Hoplias malabaricus]|uniref:hepcidin-1 n=1 Tax=Hoplias malabaricus TaxID=27720 RepID=UPI003461DD8A